MSCHPSHSTQEVRPHAHMEALYRRTRDTSSRRGNRVRVGIPVHLLPAGLAGERRSDGDTHALHTSGARLPAFHFAPPRRRLDHENFNHRIAVAAVVTFNAVPKSICARSTYQALATATLRTDGCCSEDKAAKRQEEKERAEGEYSGERGRERDRGRTAATFCRSESLSTGPKMCWKSVSAALAWRVCHIKFASPWTFHSRTQICWR